MFLFFSINFDWILTFCRTLWIFKGRGRGQSIEVSGSDFSVSPYRTCLTCQISSWLAVRNPFFLSLVTVAMRLVPSDVIVFGRWDRDFWILRTWLRFCTNFQRNPTTLNFGSFWGLVSIFKGAGQSVCLSVGEFFVIGGSREGGLERCRIGSLKKVV